MCILYKKCTKVCAKREWQSWYISANISVYGTYFNAKQKIVGVNMNNDILMKMAGARKEQTASANVYDDLRREIIELNLKPGAIISIKDICEHFGTSRSPVRDALIRLEQEGLITSLPQRGTMISKIDFSRVEQERFFRVCVEERVMNEFIDRHTREDIDRLEKILELQLESVKNEEYRYFMELDDEFHAIFYEATGKSFCAKMIQQVSGHYRRVRLLTTVDMTISENVLEQHQQILEAVKKGDSKALHLVLNKHLSKIQDEEITFCKKYPDLFTESSSFEREPDFWKEDFLKSLNK